MKMPYRFLKKSYAMKRMGAAIERAIESRSSIEKEQAARWAAAWGLLCGIKTKPVNIKRGEIVHGERRVDESFTPHSADIVLSTASPSECARPADVQPSDPQGDRVITGIFEPVGPA